MEVINEKRRQNSNLSCLLLPLSFLLCRDILISSGNDTINNIKKTKKVLDRNDYFNNCGIMMIFDLEFKRKSLKGFKPLSWLFDEHDDDEDSVRLSKTGYVFMSLFYATLIAFCYMALYLTPCYSLPTTDVFKIGQCIDSERGSELCVKVFDIAFDSDHDVRNCTHFIGVFDPTKQFPSLYGFSCSYTNYIRSTSYRFT